MKCLIQWIDGKGNPTPDTNDAVCMAVNIQTNSGGISNTREFPCCALHAIRLEQYADLGIQPDNFGGTSQWIRRPLPQPGDASSPV